VSAAASGAPRASPLLASLSALARLGRFRFLAGGVVLYGLGTVLAARTRPLNLMAYAIGQCAITTTQLMTHYANDYFDLRADRANPTPTKWSGGSRVLADGQLSPKVAWNATLLLAAVSLVLDTWILLGIHVSPGTPLLLLVVLILSFEYSGPPLCLHARSLGPLTAGLVVGALTPLAGFGMQGGAWSRESLLAVVPTMLAQFAMILVLDFPDAVGDAKAGKRTMVVRLGRARTTRVCVGVMVATYASVPLLAWADLPIPMAAALVLTVPAGIWLAWTLLRGTWRRGGEFAPLVWRGVLWFTLVSLAEVAGALATIVGR